MVTYNPRKVIEIFNNPQFKETNLNWVQKQLSSDRYNKSDLKVAHVLKMERNLQIAANQLTDDLYIKFKQDNNNLKHDLYTKPITPREALKRLKKFNGEVGVNTLYETLPLYFSPDLKSKDSIFLDKKMRELFYKAFLLLLKQDKIKLSDLKKKYLDINDHHHLMPLHDDFYKLELELKEKESGKFRFDAVDIIIGSLYAPLYIFIIVPKIFSSDNKLTDHDITEATICNVIFFTAIFLIMINWG